MGTLTKLEAAVLQKLLSGESPVLDVLRRQAGVLSVRSREFTGVGFVTSFTVPQGVERTAVRVGKSRFGDVLANMPGVAAGAGFLLHIEDGTLDALEGYTFEGPWPDQVNEFTLSYEDPAKRDFGDLDV